MQPRPEPVAVDQHAPALERVDHQHGSVLGVLEAHELHVAPRAALEPTHDLSHAGRARLREGDEKVDIRALAGCSGGLRAEQHRESNVWFGAKRSAQRPQQRPLRSQVGLFAKRGAKAPRTRAFAADQALGGGPAQRAFGDVEVSGEAAERVRHRLVWPISQHRVADSNQRYGRSDGPQLSPGIRASVR